MPDICIYNNMMTELNGMILVRISICNQKSIKSIKLIDLRIFYYFIFIHYQIKEYTTSNFSIFINKNLKVI